MDTGLPEFDLTGRPTPALEIVGAVWRNRPLLVVLARKDFFVRFRRTSFGLVWAVGLPLIQALVLSFVLHHFVRFKTGGNYTLFVYSGTLCWTYFMTAITSGCPSIVDGQDIATKIYFPRALFPLVTVVSNAYGFVLSVVVLFVLALVEGVTPGWHALLVFPAIGLTIVLATAFSLVLAALQVYFRDLKFLLSAVLIPWFYVTPVFYPLDSLGRFRTLVEWNPTTAMVELFRAVVVPADHGWTVSLWSAFGWIVVLLVGAILLYRRFDRDFVDLL